MLQQPRTLNSLSETSVQTYILSDTRSCSFVFFLFAFSRATPEAYGGSQASGLIVAVAASLRQSHSNAGSELHLQPTPQLTAMDP